MNSTPGPAADRRARDLFESLLTPEEHKEWQRTNRVTVTGSEGGVYQLLTGQSLSDNVYRINPETKQRTAVLCAAPNMWPQGSTYGSKHLPLWDGWAGQLLALRYNEARFEQVACKSYW